MEVEVRASVQTGHIPSHQTGKTIHLLSWICQVEAGKGQTAVKLKYHRILQNSPSLGPNSPNISVILTAQKPTSTLTDQQKPKCICGRSSEL